ncbi:diacylglycerol kinase beta [Thecamonas trahens ATCC 50062]|uniref:Diacylglycerol kinase n=1 Tax=Thecamonas trahens ATCC 50062 TaxID=461836 RepID=A0A0L0DS19_THETB|nr:diacylglycerol kinase beta [Thecamonas trahens ATCC 50062]KNC54841.1 diacylglycerol kinase beta [Thecamonas trahens ATCC 50062]|eukprot:XP_013761738.1 diacylglycerol kinase beta [Thecamonas trahens ATCC 50062]
MAEAGRAVLRTLHAVQLEETMMMAAAAAQASAAWVGLMRFPMVLVHLVRELIKVAIPPAVLVGIWLIRRCGEPPAGAVRTDPVVEHAVVAVVAYGIVACLVHAAAEAVSALRIGPYWHSDVHMATLKKALLDAATLASACREGPEHTLRPEARAAAIPFADDNEAGRGSGSVTTSRDPTLIGIQHTFVTSTVKGVSFCNVCTKAVRGLGASGLECSCCGYVVHAKCVADADARCKVYVAHAHIDASLTGAGSSEVLALPDGTNAPLEHLWVAGNCPGRVPSTCMVCYKSTASARGLKHYRCAWCQATVHESHLADAPRSCSLGIHAPLIVPPGAVGLETDNAGEVKYVMRPVAGARPLLVFINPKAGGRQGEALFPVFQQLLNPAQVFDLMKGGPAPGLRAFRGCTNFQIVCAGGDGTVGWIMQEVDKAELGGYVPPIAVIPLGTGNDLARSLGWGGGYEGEDVHDILVEMAHGRIYPLDRWQLSVAGVDGSGSDESAAGAVASHNTSSVLNNYFSIGLDSKLALQFHTAREANPGKFSSRLYNKYYYGKVGSKQLLTGCGETLLAQVITLTVDGRQIDLGKAQGLMVLNLPSYAAGCNFWGSSPRAPWKVAATDDGLLEVVAITSAFHLSRCASKKRWVGAPIRLAQGASIVIDRLPDAPPLPMQVDGEPWAQDFTSLDISFLNQAHMLTHPERAIVVAQEIVVEDAATRASGPPQPRRPATAPAPQPPAEDDDHSYDYAYESYESVGDARV